MNQNPEKSSIVLFYYEFSKLKPATYRRKVVLNELFFVDFESHVI